MRSPTGSTTKLSVISDRADNVLTIPVDAVYYSGGDAYVYTYDNGTVHYVPVEVGAYTIPRRHRSFPASMHPMK